MNPWYRSFHFFCTVVARLFFSFRCYYSERMPQNEAVIVALNHQSYLDPSLGGICFQRPIWFLAKKTLFKHPFMAFFLPRINVIGVDRDGNDMSALKLLIKLVRAGDCVALFPEGTRSPDGKLQPARPGIGLLIAKTLAPVLPVRIFGSYEAYPKGQKYPKFSPITVVVGEPIRFTKEEIEAGGRDLYQHLSDRVMEAIAAIELPKR